MNEYYFEIWARDKKLGDSWLIKQDIIKHNDARGALEEVKKFHWPVATNLTTYAIKDFRKI